MWKDAVPLAASERTTNPQITETLPTHIHMCVCGCVQVWGGEGADQCSEFFFLFTTSVISLQYEFTLKYVKLCNNNMSIYVKSLARACNMNWCDKVSEENGLNELVMKGTRTA